MKKVYAVSALLFVFLFCFSGCGKDRFKEDDILGSSSLEIMDRYGDFDRAQSSPDGDGLYRDCACGYLVTEAKKGFLGTTPPEYFMIYFDEDGIAVLCRYEQVV